jgi:hypothetical protein
MTRLSDVMASCPLVSSHCSVRAPGGAILRSLIAGQLASLNLLFVRHEASLFRLHARSARRAEIGSRRAAGPRAAVLTQSSTTRGCDEVGRHRCRIMVLSAVGPRSVTRAAATWRSGRPVLLMSRARSPLRCGPLRRKRSHRASSRQGRPPARQPGGTVGGSDASGHPGAIKVAIAFPDDMHDDGEFVCHGHGGPTQPNPHHQCTPPASQRAIGYLARENGRLEQIRAQKPVAAFSLSSVPPGDDRGVQSNSAALPGGGDRCYALRSGNPLAATLESRTARTGLQT